MDHTQTFRPGSNGAATAKWLFLITFLTLFAIVDSIHDYVARRGEGTPIDVVTEIEWGLLYWGPCLALVPATLLLVNRHPLNFESMGSVLFHSVGGLVFTYVHMMIEAIPKLQFAPSLGYWGRFFSHLKFDFALDYAFYCVIVFSSYLLRQYSDLKEGELRASQLEVGLAETRLRAVQAQLNPHFFFNTLQSISVMALSGERDGVVEMLARLSSLLRVSFDKHRPQRITLAQEMEFLAEYLAILQLSFGSRLSVRNDVAAETLEASVPAMLLQPVVENAIVHGISVKPGQGTVRITSRRQSDRLILEVSDSGPGFRTHVPSGSGVGLSATESRLRLIFGTNQSIEYGHSDLGGANVRISIPFTLDPVFGLRVPRNGVAA